MSDSSISSVALLVYDYDEAIAYFTSKLGFLLLEDSRIVAIRLRTAGVGP